MKTADPVPARAATEPACEVSLRQPTSSIVPPVDIAPAESPESLGEGQWRSGLPLFVREPAIRHWGINE